jgi:hypothetical protein
MKKFSILFIALAVIACTKGGKPRDVVIDRDVCARCSMQVSDPRFPAQVHNTDGTNYVFEEIGCAISWLAMNENANYTLFVTDLKNPGKWLRAEEAVFTVEYSTPMSYGVAALASAADVEEGKSIISYDAAVESIMALNLERQQKMGGGHHMPSDGE